MYLTSTLDEEIQSKTRSGEKEQSNHQVAPSSPVLTVLYNDGYVSSTVRHL